MTAIGALYSKNRQFQAIMDEIHAMPECRNLTLQHHMLSPIQRIPRYELLLKEYIQKLPDNSPDARDSQSALIQVSQAAGSRASGELSGSFWMWEGNDLEGRKFNQGKILK